jgi:hypothetical protein
VTGLILLILAITVAGATLAVSINYANPLAFLGTNYGTLSVDSFQALSNAYIKATSPPNSSYGYLAAPTRTQPVTYYAVPPPVPLDRTTTPDGGLTAFFVPTFLPMLPGAPAGYMWVYGPAGAASTAAHWVCLTPIPGYPGIGAQQFRALQYTFTRFHRPGVNSNLMLSSTCGVVGGPEISATLYLQSWPTVH